MNALLSSRPSAVWLRGAVVAAVVLAALWPGLWTLPPIDRDESRFAQASRQMADGGFWDWVVPRVGERPRLNKPPLIYWLQAASARMSGDPAALDGAWAVVDGGERQKHSLDDAARRPAVERGGIGWFRLPSVASAILAAVLTYLLGRALFVGPTAVSDSEAEDRRDRGDRNEDKRSGALVEHDAESEARRTIGEAAAFIGALLLGTCVMVLWDGRQARADQLLLATTTAAVFGLFRCWRDLGFGVGVRADDGLQPRSSSTALLWVALALGVLTKGPVTPLVVGGAMLGLGLLTGRWRWLGRLRWWAAPVALLFVVGLWVALVAVRFGLGEYVAIIYDEVIVRSKEAAEGHWGPPGYHVVLLPLVFWPGSMLLFAAAPWLVSRTRGAVLGRDAGAQAEAAGAVGGGRFANLLAAARRRAAARGHAGVFLIAWIVPAWIVFEAVTTKLPHYTLPMYPAIALACGWFAAYAAAGRATFARTLLDRMLAAAAVVIGLAPVAASLYLFEVTGSPTPAGAIVGVCVAAAIAGVMVWLYAVKRRALAGALAGVGLACASSAVIVGEVLPALRNAWLSPAVARALVNAGAEPSDAIAAVGYREDSLVFLLDGEVHAVGLRGVDAWVEAASATCGDAIVVMRVPTGWADDDGVGEAARADRIEPVAAARGFHYNGGGWQEVWVLPATEARALAAVLLERRERRQSEREASDN